MLKGSPILVLSAAGVACLAIGVGVFTNNREELTPLAPMVSEHVSRDADPVRKERVELQTLAVATPEPDAFTVDEETTNVAMLDGAAPDAGEIDESENVATVATDATVPHVEPQSLDEALRGACVAFEGGDFATVVTLLEPAAAIDDSHFDVHYLLGLALRYEGRADQSVAAIDAALAIQPNSVRAWTNSARALLETRDLAQAEERVRRAIELAPEDVDAWNVLGRVHLNHGALPQAEDAFARVLEIQPEHAWALNNLGFARLQRGAWEEATEVLERAVLAKSDVAAFHNNLGVAYERLSRLSDAQRAFAEALTLQPDYAKAELSLARVTDRIAEGATDVAAEATTIASNDTTSEAQDETESSVQP